MDDARVQLLPYLRPGATLLWSGRPDPAVRFGKADRFLIPASIFICGFAIFWETMVLRGRAPWFFPIFGLPFLAMGLWLLIGRFFFKARRAKRTAYGLTNDVAIIAVGSDVTEIPLRVAPLTTSRSRDGRHVSIRLSNPPARSMFNRGGLLGITEVGNTGAEFLGGGTFTNAFYDVADVDGLLRALDIAHARTDRR